MRRPLPRRYPHPCLQPMRRRHYPLWARRFRPCRPLLLPIVRLSARPPVSANTVATYTVVSGDCLSTIALRFYGDEGAWNEIWAANANRMMADGMRFVRSQSDLCRLEPRSFPACLPRVPLNPLQPIRRPRRHCRRIRRRPSWLRSPAPTRRERAVKGVGAGLGVPQCRRGPFPGRVRPDAESSLGTAPTRAGRRQRAGRGWGTSWREQRR